MLHVIRLLTPTQDLVLRNASSGLVVREVLRGGCLAAAMKAAFREVPDSALQGPLACLDPSAASIFRSGTDS
jgi:hypothetical protein